MLLNFVPDISLVAHLNVILFSAILVRRQRLVTDKYCYRNLLFVCVYPSSSLE